MITELAEWMLKVEERLGDLEAKTLKEVVGRAAEKSGLCPTCLAPKEEEKLTLEEKFQSVLADDEYDHLAEIAKQHYQERLDRLIRQHLWTPPHLSTIEDVRIALFGDGK